MIAAGLAPHALWLVALAAMTIAALTPTLADWTQARTQSIRTVTAAYPDLAGEADLIADDAIAEALPRYTHGSFAALATSIAKRRALDRLREREAEREGYDELRAEAEEEQEATSPEYDRPEPVDVDAKIASITVDQTRAAVLAECYRRLGAAVGSGSIIDDTFHSGVFPQLAVNPIRSAASRASEMLRLARASPTLLHHLTDLAGLECLAALEVPEGEQPRGRRRVLIRGDDGAVKVYGTDATESAVLAILADSWPVVRAAEHPDTIIARKAANIRQATPKKVSTGRIRTKPKKGKR